MNKTIKIFSASLLVFLTIGVAPKLVQADDPVVVGPDIYKILLENDRVRVMEIDFKPGAKIAMHSHPAHLVYILNGGALQITTADGTVKNLEGKAGDVMWSEPETHKAENTGTTEVKGLVIELKDQKAN